jgi:hypothetical protein
MMKAVADADYETAIKESSRCYTIIVKGVAVIKHLTERNEATVELIRDGHKNWIKVNK